MSSHWQHACLATVVVEAAATDTHQTIIEVHEPTSTAAVAAASSKQRLTAVKAAGGGGTAALRSSSASSVSSAGDSDCESGSETDIEAETPARGKSKKTFSGALYLSVAADVVGSDDRSLSGNHLRPAEAKRYGGGSGIVGPGAATRRRRSLRTRSRSPTAPSQTIGQAGGGGLGATDSGSCNSTNIEASTASVESARGGFSVGSSPSGGSAASAVAGSRRETGLRPFRKQCISEPSSACASQRGSLRRMAIAVTSEAGRAISLPGSRANARLPSTAVAAARLAPSPLSLRPAAAAERIAAAVTAAAIADDESATMAFRRTDTAAGRTSLRDFTPLDRATLATVEKTVEAIDDLRGRPEHDIDLYVHGNVEDATLSVVRHCLKAVLSMEVDGASFQRCSALAEQSRRRRKRRSASKRRRGAEAVANASRPKRSHRSGAAAGRSVPSHVVARRRSGARGAVASAATKTMTATNAGPPPRVRPTETPERGYEWALRRVGCPQDMANYYYYRHSTKPRYRWVQVKIRPPPPRPKYDWASAAGYAPLDERAPPRRSDDEWRHFPPHCYPIFNSLRHPFSAADAPPQMRIAPLAEPLARRLGGGRLCALPPVAAATTAVSSRPPSGKRASSRAS